MLHFKNRNKHEQLMVLLKDLKVQGAEEKIERDELDHVLNSVMEVMKLNELGKFACHSPCQRVS